MKFTLAEPKYLKDSIGIISDLVNEVRFKVDKDKIEIVAMDPANVAMIIFKLLSSAFVDYDVKEPIEIAVSLDNLKQILRRAKPSDILKVELDDKNNRLNIELGNRVFNLSLIDIEEREQKIPDLKFPAKIEMSTVIFDEAIEDMDVVSDAVLFEVSPEKFIIQATGNVSEGRVEIGKDENTSIELGTKDNLKAKYSIEYLKKIIKGSKLSDRVNIWFNKDYPLKIEYKVLDKLSFSVILAPRVENI